MFERTFSFWRRLVGRSVKPAAADPPPDPEADRRVWVRYPADLETTLQPATAPPENRYAAKVRDVSQGGIHLLVNRRFAPGDLISIELPTGDDAATHTVLACIVRVQPEGAEEWALGCVFSRELADDDLHSFGARRQRHASADQRQWMRFPCQVQARYQKVAASDAPPAAAQILNISPSGIGLLVQQPMEAGLLLSVQLLPPTGKPGCTMLACVVHVTAQANGEYALGCNFIRELTEADLQALVEG